MPMPIPNMLYPVDEMDRLFDSLQHNFIDNYSKTSRKLYI